MFGRKPKTQAKKLNEVADKILDELIAYKPGSAGNYTVMLSHLEKVTTLQSRDRRGVNPDTMALVAGNLLGILVIVAYEQKHVMTSKGLGFVLKSK